MRENGVNQILVLGPFLLELIRVELELLEHMLLHISEREAEILSLRFGLGAEEPQTLREVGRRMGLSRERVRQIEKRTLAKLKDALTRGGPA